MRQSTSLGGLGHTGVKTYGYFNPVYLERLRIIFSHYVNAPCNSESTIASLYTFIYGFFDIEPIHENIADYFYGYAISYDRDINELIDWLTVIANEFSEIHDFRVTSDRLMVIGRAY